MSRRTLADWKAINESFEASQQSATTFCRENNIDVKYFYAIRARLKKQAQPNGFIKAKPLQTEPSGTVCNESIKLQFGDISLSLQSTVSADWLAKLIRALT